MIPAQAYKYSSVSGYAMIDGTKTDICGFTATFSVNSIPTASIALPLGFKPTSGTLSAGSGINRLLSHRPKVKVYVIINGVTRLVFDGYGAGTSMRRTGLSSGIEMKLVHWLSDLSTTSPFTVEFTPAAMNEISVTPTLMIGATGTSDSPSLTMSGIASLVSSTIQTGNLLRAIKKLLSLYTEGITTQAAVSLKNVSAAAAVNKISGKLSFSVDLDGLISEGVVNELAAVFGNLYAQNTLWGAMMTLSSSFLFIWVPLVESVAAVPFTPVLANSRYIRTLSGVDFVYLQTSDANSRPLRGLYLYAGGTQGSTGTCEGEFKTADSKFFISEKIPDGVTDAASAPAWLSNTVPLNAVQYTYGKGMYGRTEPKLADDDMADPMDTEVVVTPGLDANSMGVKLAETIFYTRQSAGNSAVLRTPLLWNLGPGSLLRLGVPKGKSDADAAVDLLAYVTAVSITVDANTSAAYMDFNLSHMRGMSAAGLDVTRSPIYSDVMLYSGLNGGIVYNKKSAEEEQVDADRARQEQQEDLDENTQKQ